MRSSGRIPKEIPILLMGSDLGGRVFAEPTKTVLLSIDGAGILSRHKLSPEQALVLRWPQRNKEAEIRIVGHLGSAPAGHTYGVAFFDPKLNFWEMDFPSSSPAQREMGLLSLVCTSCQTLERIDGASIEADVCSANEGVIRLCKRCGTSTLWKSVKSERAPETAPAESGQLSLFSEASAPTSVAKTSPDSLCASANELPEIIAPSPVPAAPVLTPPLPQRPPFRRDNRRKRPRVKVNYPACVRHPDRGEEIVICEDMSKGGLRFTSHRRYYVQSIVEVAVPYVHGQPAIFVPAQIVFVQELPEQRLYRYGVAYLRPF